MKRKSVISIYFLFILFIPVRVYCSDWFNPAIKLGINFNKSQYKTNNCINEYYYPPGISIGISNKIRLNQPFYISNDCYYKYKQSKMHVNFATPEWNFLLYRTEYIRISTLLGIEYLQFSDILIGFDFGKLLRADYIISNYKKLKPNNTDEFEITETVPNFDASFCLGVSKDFKINTIRLLTEIKYLVGIKRYKYFSQLGGIRQKFRNHNLDCSIGFIL